MNTSPPVRRIAVMTGGGDCPGLNAAIRAITRVAIHHHGYEVIGVRNGFEGLIRNTTVPLGSPNVRGILRVGGTILGSSNRTNPFRYTGPARNEPEYDASDEAFECFQFIDADALIVLGGDGTLLLAGEFGRKYGVPVVGIPKTIDNDVHGTDYAIGFDSAVTTVTNAVDNLHTIAVIAEGIPGPEGTAVYRSQAGALHNWKLGGIAAHLVDTLTPTVNQEVRSIVLGHLQRGGAPTAFDRALATQLGAGAVQTITEGGSNVVVGIRAQEIATSPLHEVARGPRRIPDDHPMVAAAIQMGMYLG